MQEKESLGMYAEQYSEMYRDRVIRIGERIKAHAEKEERAEHMGVSFFVGCIAVETERASIVKCIYKVEKEEDLPEEGEPGEKKYFLEQMEGERMILEVDEEKRKNLVSGGVIGVLGRKKDKIIRVERIIFPIEAYESKETHKKVNHPEESALFVPQVVSHLKKDQGRKIIEKIRDLKQKKETKIFFYEGVCFSDSSKSDILNSFLSLFPSSSLIPGPRDRMLPMLPYDVPSSSVLSLDGKYSLIGAPSVVCVGGKDILLCALSSVESVLWFSEKKEGNEGYFLGLSLILQYMHASPCSPDMCPAYPRRKDPFVLESIPDVLLLQVGEGSSEIRRVTILGKTVDLIVLSEMEKRVLLLEKSPSLENI